jgi:hypothetical protein
MTRKLLGAAALTLLMAAGAGADAVKGEWTGWITDTHCGVRGANKDHTAACVEKCMKTGKAQLWVGKDKKGYDLTAFDAKTKALVGSRVVVKGTQDSATGAITVDSIEKAPDSVNP